MLQMNLSIKRTHYIFNEPQYVSHIKASANGLCIIFMICTLLNNPTKASSFYSVMERTKQNLLFAVPLLTSKKISFNGSSTFIYIC